MPKDSVPPKDGSRPRRKKPAPRARGAQKKLKRPAREPGAELPARPSASARGASGESGAKPRRRTAAAAAPRRAAAPRPRGPGKHPEPEPETGARSKFELGVQVPEPPVEHIPWGYGQDRITAMVVDPRRMYAYWELRDDAIEAARAALGPAGRGAWLNLRVYDISGRIFDGTNAHGYFDVKVERHDRQWFFDIGKPTSTHCVEIGMRSSEGYFRKIARSGSVHFPRAEPSGPGPVEWLSVHDITGEIGAPVPGAPPAHAPAPAAATPARAHPPAGWADGEYWVLSDASALQEWAFLSGWEGHDFWHTEWVGGHGRLEWFAGGQRFEWVGPLVRTTWESGPFPAPIEAPGLVEERHEGPVLIQKLGDQTRIIYGPWQVAIRGVGGRAQGRVLARWEVRKAWVTNVGFEVTGGALRWGAPAPAQRRARAPGASEGLALGASERRWMVGSEVRLAGASEVFRVGASEFRYLGGSELLLAGASEMRFRGASERRLRGASERLVRGASERILAGASERMRAGASERIRGGASERHGASERRLGGASEKKAPSRYPAGAGAARRK